LDILSNGDILSVDILSDIDILSDVDILSDMDILSNDRLDIFGLDILIKSLSEFNYYI
jgi:hypothetical protein